MDLLTSLALLVFLLVFLAVAIKVIAKLTCGHYKITTDLSDKSVLITGATSGIGEMAALELARHGARVHLLCRNGDKARKVSQLIKQQTDNQQVFVWQVDTSSLTSVRTFAHAFLATTHDVDILINNAGLAWIQHRTVTEEGLEVTMATNHFGHFLLTNLLLDRIKQSKCANPRIVNVSSVAHWLSNIDFNDVNMERGYSGSRAYNCSKLANILFTKHLARLLADTNVTVNCLHPGAVATDLFRSVSRLLRPFIPLLRLWFKTAEEGAESITHLAVAPQLVHVSGQYFWDCQRALVSRQANNPMAAQRLWDISKTLTGC